MNEINNEDLYYKVISNLYLDNNAFIYIQRDENNVVTGLYPIKSNSYKLLEYQDNVYIQFSFASGKKYTASLRDEVIHLKRFYCENDILGGSNKPIIKTMSVKHIVEDALSGDQPKALDYVKTDYVQKFGHHGMTDGSRCRHRHGAASRQGCRGCV